MYSIGQRVGIVSGLQAAGGPSVVAYGTVTRVEEFWVGTLEYQVTPDDGSEALWYREYLLRPMVTGDAWDAVDDQPWREADIVAPIIDAWSGNPDTDRAAAVDSRRARQDRYGYGSPTRY
jgi:hypothetical protein